MSKGKCIDYIGQEVGLGDWCAVTQNNEMYVGKTIKVGNTVTIAINSLDEFLKTEKKLKGVGWKEQDDLVKAKFGPNSSRWISSPSWVRDGKFVKITPTQKMIVSYDTTFKK